MNNFDLNSFSTLQNVQHLFENERALLAGWIHYLAFDLYMGVQIVKQTQELKISHLYNLFLLPVTFLFGPIGFVLFFLIKTYKQNYVSD